MSSKFHAATKVAHKLGPLTDRNVIVFPSELATSLFDPFRINRDIPMTEEGAFARSWQPAERAGSDDDMAGLILYMTSKAGSFLNGSVLLVDGGKVATIPSTY